MQLRTVDDEMFHRVHHIDDATVRKVGTWEDVVDKVVQAQYMPLLFFFLPKCRTELHKPAGGGAGDVRSESACGRGVYICSPLRRLAAWDVGP
jgi:hypothetical protein